MKAYAQNRSKPRQLSRNSKGSGAKPHAASHVVHQILHLQRSIGNQAVGRLLRENARRRDASPDASAATRPEHETRPSETPAGFQAKLTVNAPGDIYEREADSISEQVMRLPEPKLQRACACGGGCPTCRTGQSDRERGRVQTKSVGPGGPGQTAAPPVVSEALASPGHPLDAATRAFMEPRFGHDFSGVRVHSGGGAAEGASAVSARAFTVGRDIVFGAGEYAPATTEGKRILAHELVHVLQQTPAETGPVVQRLTEGQRREDLRSPKYAGDARLQAAFDNNPAMHFGETNEGVRLVQEGLVADGFPMTGSTRPTGEMDGVFGQETLTAVKQFQGKHGLSVDGVVGRETLSELDRLEAGRSGGDACSCPPGMEPAAPAEEPFADAFAPGGGEFERASFTPTAGGSKAKTCPTCKKPSTKPKAGVCPAKHTQAELDASRASNGRFDEPGSVGPTIAQQALMWDFEQGQTATRQNHQNGAFKMVVDFGLGTTAPSAKIAILQGHTDCVDRENVNSPLREGRAHAARELFKEVGALEENIGPAEAASQGPLPGNDSTPEGRARNRSVVILVMPPPKLPDRPPEPKGPPRRCDGRADPGQKWLLEDVGSATAGGGPGAGLFAFILKNCDTGCEYEALFVGFGGGLGIGVSVSLPGGTKFSSPFLVSPKDFEGDASVFSASIGVGPVAAEHAFIRLRAVKTTPAEIDIGGFEGGFGGEIGVIGLEGKFHVRRKGFPRMPCL
ncbi:MAG TPA: DUF4157 domain-containing protein [Pyrinomonadaceae bacterium]|nr:DUF4157 domain-containing protein [Pyrinomonadaceae bacterium]